MKETGDCSLTLEATLVDNMQSIRMWLEVGDSNEGVRERERERDSVDVPLAAIWIRIWEIPRGNQLGTLLSGCNGIKQRSWNPPLDRLSDNA